MTSAPQDPEATQLRCTTSRFQVTLNTSRAMTTRGISWIACCCVCHGRHRTKGLPQIPSRRLRGIGSNKASIEACCFSGDMHAGQWMRCPRLFLTNLLYRAQAQKTAATLSAVGLWNWLGDEKMIVDVYEHISNRFCQLASTAEKAPRFSASTSYIA